MSEPIVLSPAEIASYDQAYAYNIGLLETLFLSHAQWSAEYRRLNIPQQLAAVSLAGFLAQNWDADLLASVLAAAVNLLTEQLHEPQW